MLVSSSHSLVFRVLFCALLATSIGQSVMLTTLPSLGRKAELSEFHIAAIMSSSALIFAIGTSIWSKIAKRVGFKRILMLGLTGYSIGTLVFASTWMTGFTGIITGSTLFLALLISRTLQSTIMSATPPAAVGYAVSISSIQTRVSAISKVTSASNVGQIIGPAYAGLLVSLGLLVPLYSIVLLTILAIILVHFKLPELTTTTILSDSQRQQLEQSGYNKVPYVFVVACVFVFTAMAMMQQSLGFFLMDFYHLSPVDAASKVGIAMMISAAASLIVQFTLVQKARIAKETMITLALPLLAIGYVCLYFQQSFAILYIAMTCMGIGMGMAYPALAAAATTYCTPSQLSLITGLITATTAMGYIVGPPAAAWLYQTDIALPFAVAAMLMALIAIVLFTTLFHLRRAHIQACNAQSYTK
ncbi:MFS transporter [Alteromonas sp. D210916BOD_24]|uniref:MFS transporter n=1 Tax=Alteromonas sp. D210916BOD_24 TaxID=3157618 RepID=UPI00399C74C8